ncbi:MAG: hypothetical protein ACM33B_16105 [Pseudomonadota bacterium]
MATLRLSRHHAVGQEHRPGPFARMREIAREGSSASTPLVLLVLVSGALLLFIAITLAVAMLIYELAL